eukprot:4995179-Prymnesium_polylepis.1
MACASAALAGSVIFNFARKGRLALTKEIDEEELLELAIEAGVDGDVSVEVRPTPPPVRHPLHRRRGHRRQPCVHSRRPSPPTQPSLHSRLPPPSTLPPQPAAAAPPR